MNYLMTLILVMLAFFIHGQDVMGDDIPPDELNRVSKENEHFGFPYVHSGSVLAPEFAKRKSLVDYQHFSIPELAIQVHSAPLGIYFYQGKQFSNTMKNQFLMAEQDSWNRSIKVGYQVKIATIVNGTVKTYQPFITGFLDKENTLGRPVAFSELADGTLLVSDDYANAVYRVRYNNI